MKPIQIKKVIKFYLKRFIIFIIAMVIAGIMGIIYSTKIKVPMYLSKTTLVLTKLDKQKEVEVEVEKKSTNKTQSNKVVTEMKKPTMQPEEYEFDSYLVTDYCKLATTDKILESVISKLELKETVEELKKKVSVTEIESTNMFTIKAKYEEPEIAKKIVETISEEIQEKSKEIYTIDNIYDLQEAKVAEEPYNSGKMKDLLIAELIGFISAFTVVTLIYYFKEEK